MTPQEHRARQRPSGKDGTAGGKYIGRNRESKTGKAKGERRKSQGESGGAHREDQIPQGEGVRREEKEYRQRQDAQAEGKGRGGKRVEGREEVCGGYGILTEMFRRNRVLSCSHRAGAEKNHRPSCPCLAYLYRGMQQRLLRAVPRPSCPAGKSSALPHLSGILIKEVKRMSSARTRAPPF